MKIKFLAFCLLLIASNSYSQEVSKVDFNDKLLNALGEQYNIVEVPNGFKDCAYNLYENDTIEIKDDGLHAGIQIAQNCLIKYFDQIKFTDKGKKFRDISLNYFTSTCQEQNKAYESQVNVTGYCNCLRTQYDNYKISLETLIKPEFAESDQYKRLALSCFKQNQKN